MEISEKLQAVLATLPPRTGCYLMKNVEGKIIYVGKAVNLRSRVRSYFHAEPSHDAKTWRLVREIGDVEWIIVGSELEALILEMNLIKKHRPKYNVRLKDDKRYPYIKIHWAEPFPKVTVTRQMADDGSRYFGPYTSAWAVYQTLDVLRRIFPYLTCDREITGMDKRACLYYDIKLCTAPCIGAVNQAQYRQTISDLMDFLNGHSEEIVSRLHRDMEKASGEMRQNIVEYNLQGAVAELPAGEMRFAVGLGGRENRFEFKPDPLNSQESVLDQLAGFFPVGDAFGKTEATEAYGELLLASFFFWSSFGGGGGAVVPRGATRRYIDMGVFAVTPSSVAINGTYVLPSCAFRKSGRSVIAKSLGAGLPNMANPATPPAVATPIPATRPTNIDRLM